MRRLNGPILYLRQGTSTHWCFAVGVWVAAPEEGALALEFDAVAGATVSPDPILIGSFGPGDCLVWEVSVLRQAEELRTSYTLRGFSEGPIEIDHVVVPACGQAARLAFFSCNGVQDPKDWTSQPEMERAWTQMRARHEAGVDADGSGGPYHVLVGGGDQIYCDAVWNDIPELRALDSWKKRQAKKVTPALTARIEALYAKLYERWRKSEFAELQARVPGVYTWDDHDIFDGWGSYDTGLQSCELFQEIFAIARRAFMRLQLGIGDDRPGLCLDPTQQRFQQAVNFDGQYDLLLLDLRSDRTETRVLSEEQWTSIKEYLKGRAGDANRAAHLLVVSTIPVVYLNFGFAERFLDWLPWRQDLEDDLRDQWESRGHQEERARLIMTLLDHAAVTGTRVSILSGDVHVGSRGRIVSRRPEHLHPGASEAIIHQLTSSAIVYPPPGAFALAGMRTVAKDGPMPLLAVSHVETEVLPLCTEHFLLGSNNWLAVEPDVPWGEAKRRLWVRWITAEGETKPPLLVHANP